MHHKTFCSMRKINQEKLHVFVFVVNAADNKQRDPGMTTIKIDIDP